MIDIALARTNPDLVRQTCRAKGSDVDVERLIFVDSELRSMTVRMEELRARQKRQGRDTDIKVARALKEELRESAEQARLFQEERDALWVRVPNLIAEDTPVGDDEEGNVELRREGDTVAADESRAHDTIGARLHIFDMARGAEVAGSGFYYWRGDGARLAWAIFSYAQDLLLGRGFVPMLTPPVARERT